MNWDDIRVFLAVSQTGNVTRAASVLAINPATVGRRISRLERELDCQLFAKSPSGYLLTSKGLELLENAKRIGHEFHSLHANADLKLQKLVGSVRVGAPDGCATFVLPQVFGQIMVENPGLELEIVSLARSNDLLRRQVDITIEMQPHTAKTVESVQLCDYELILALDRHRLERAGTTFDQTDHPFVGYIDDLLSDQTLSSRNWSSDAPSQLVSNSISVQWRWITGGFGVGFVHDFAFSSASNLVQVQPELAIKRRYYLSRVRSRDGIDHLGDCFELLRQRISDEIGRLRSSTGFTPG